MNHARQLVLLVGAASNVIPLVWARPSSPTHAASAVARTDELSIQRTLIDESNAARKVGDYASARALAAEVVTYLLARPLPEQDAAWLALLDSAGFAAYYAHDSLTANGAWNRVYEVRLATLPDDHAELQKARQQLAVTRYELGDLAGARDLQERVLEVRLAALPDDHADVQLARQNLAVTRFTLGDLAGARALFEKVLAVNSRTLPDDHPELQKARLNVAVTIKALGDLAGARALEEKVLEVNSRTLPDDHPDLQKARQNLAGTIQALGDVAGARALYEKVLEVSLRTLPGDHPDLQAVRLNLASMIKELGDLAGARVLEEQVLEVNSRTLPDDHAELQAARMNLANTLQALGDLAGARALLDKVLEVRAATLPADHPDLQKARLNLANTLYKLGDLAGARTLEERALEVYLRTLPDDHPDLQSARLNLAGTIKELGDLAGARALEEKALEIDSRTLPDDHPALQRARQNLAVTIQELGDLAGARDLFEKVLEVNSRTLPDDHPAVQMARANLAVTIKELGDLAGARALEEQVFAIDSRTLPDDHPDLQAVRMNLASTLRMLGDLAGARELYEQVLEVRSATLPDDHGDLQLVRQNLAGTLVSQIARASRSSEGAGARTIELEGARERCTELIGSLCRARMHAARAAIVSSPAREAEERCSRLAKQLDQCLSFAQGYGVLAPLVELESLSFAYAETTRGAAIASAELTRRAANSSKYGALRDALREASAALAGLAQQGTTNEEFDRARMRRESVERELVVLARELSGGTENVAEIDVESLAERLGMDEALVSFRRCAKFTMSVVDEVDATGQPALRSTSVESLCAFVVRRAQPAATSGSTPTSALTLVDLGPMAPIEESVHAWRAGLGAANASRGLAASAREELSSSVHTSAVSLREKIVDPLLPALANAERIVVVLDDVLHLVPFDALPIDSGHLGDRFEIQTRTTLTELLISRGPFAKPGDLIAFGDVDYDAAGRGDETGAASAPLLAAADVRRIATGRASILRGGSWEQGFSPLPGTGVEVRGIARAFADQSGGDDAEPKLCERASATRERLLELAPQARYLHIATHGWFAPESIKSWSDSEPIDKQSGLGMRMSGAEQVKGMSPMLLCGLALAGASLPENAVGRAPGLVTADELSTLDLSNCELAVLSACDTNVGERRAGQGVASLQKALQMAGARSVITSLWKVSDEATKELMLDFYRRLWVEKKPKHQALWEAKTKLRAAKDDRGMPKYTTRDWAAWVLTGEPD